MDRKNGIWSQFLRTLYLAATFIAAGCSVTDIDETDRTEVCISLERVGLQTKAYLPDEESVKNISLMIFDEKGKLETSVYLDNGDCRHTVSLLKGAKYSFFACINFGYRVSVNDIKELDEVTFHLAYPDEYREGLPMYAALKDYLISDSHEIKLEMIRLMSKISIRMDRSGLSKDVEMNVNSIRIGNCPKFTKVFSSNRVSDESECFRIGFRHEDIECQALNSNSGSGISEAVELYMMENIQGRFAPEDIDDDAAKVFDPSDPRSRRCSYIEMEMDYSSPERASIEAPLVYRFYLGENRNSLDIERNCHYRITVCPKDDGLKGDGWRVDKTGLQYIGETSLEQYPGDYISGNIGEKVHLGCILTPEDTPFDIGLDYMEEDKAEGIYDYELDPDGHGVTLTLTGPGRGMIYMKAGSPINQSALFVIEVNLPA